MTLNARTKGQAGEREFADWLKKTLNLERKPNRTLDQTRDGGADIIDVPPFFFEVKRCEKLNRNAWWKQVKTAVFDFPNKIPVVAYRQNRKKWNFLISSSNIAVFLPELYVELNEEVGIKWLKNKYDYQNKVYSDSV